MRRKFDPQAAYLAPVPAEPFTELIEALAREFPDYPPYGGAHPAVFTPGEPRFEWHPR